MALESHFTNVLQTNYAPSIEELIELQNLILEPQDKIRKLNEQIARLQAERDELQRFVDDHRALTAPFRRLPADVWRVIFIQCLPVNGLNVAVCTLKEAPLLLTTVCRVWREIALNTPRLWDSAHISFPKLPQSTTSGTPLNPHVKMLQGIKLWLDRSGSRPLTLSIYTGNNLIQTTSRGHDSVQSSDIEFVNLLVRYSRRWKVLSLDHGFKTLHQQPLDYLAVEDVPLLEAIHTGDSSLFIERQSAYPVFAAPHAENRTSTPMANFVTRISSLRSLHLHPGSLPTLGLPLHWSRLTILSFDYQPMTHPRPSPILVLQKIARACRSLTTLTYRSTIYSTPVTTVANPIEWTTLRELTLILEGSLCDCTNRVYSPDVDGTGSFPFHSCVTDIYSSIIPPQLLRLTLHLIEQQPGIGPASNDMLPFNTLIKGSPRLTHLDIAGYYILRADALARCLESAPSLTSLRLRFLPLPERSTNSRRQLFVNGRIAKSTYFPPSDWVPKLLRSLNWLDSCPQLEVFDLGWCGPHHVASVLEFAQAESRVSRLRYLKGDMGTLWRKEMIHAMTSPSLIETLKSLRIDHNISIVLDWNAAQPPSLDTPEWQNNPYNGLPGASLGEANDRC